MKINLFLLALISSAAMCTNANGFDLLDRMLCRSGCGAGTSCCGTPVQSSCCGGAPCGLRPIRPLFARGCASDCGGCDTGCGVQADCECGVQDNCGCGHMRLGLNLRCLFPRLHGCGGCDTGCGGCDTGCDTGCGGCGRTIVRRPMLFAGNSCNSCNSGCGDSCCAPRVGLLDRIRCFRPMRGGCCDSGCHGGCDNGCNSGCGGNAVPGEIHQVEPTPEATTPSQTRRYPSAPIVDPKAFVVPQKHYAGN